MFSYDCDKLKGSSAETVTQLGNVVNKVFQCDFRPT